MNITFAINVLVRSALAIACCAPCAWVADQVAVLIFVTDKHSEISWFIPATCIIQSLFDFIFVFPLLYFIDLRKAKQPTALFIFKRYLPIALFASIAFYYLVFGQSAFDFLLPTMTINSIIALAVFSLLYIQPPDIQLSLNQSNTILENETNN